MMLIVSLPYAKKKKFDGILFIDADMKLPKDDQDA